MWLWQSGSEGSGQSGRDILEIPGQAAHSCGLKRAGHGTSPCSLRMKSGASGESRGWDAQTW